MSRSGAYLALGVASLAATEACVAMAPGQPGTAPSTATLAPAPTTHPAPASTPPSPADAAETLRLQAGGLLSVHCIRCHDASSSLDLRQPPPASDHATWQMIASNVRSGRMPPTSAESPFPLDHEVRVKLAALASAIASGARRAHARPVIHASMTWASIVHEVADPFLGESEVDRVLLRYRGGIGGLRDDVDPSPIPVPMLGPLGQMNMNLISYEVCREMVDADQRAPDAERRLLRTGSGDVYAPIAAAMHERVYADSPSDGDLARERALLGRMHQRTGDMAEAAVALCTAELAGPQVMLVLPDEDGTR